MAGMRGPHLTPLGCVPLHHSNNGPHARQYRAGEVAKAEVHQALQAVAVSVLRAVPSVARLQHAQLAMAFLEESMRCDALLNVEELLSTKPEASSEEQLLAYGELAAPFAGAGRLQLHKTSSGWKLHGQHADANASALACVHLTLTERSDGQPTALHVLVGSSELVLPSVTGAVTSFIGTFYHKSADATEVRAPVAGRSSRSVEKEAKALDAVLMSEWQSKVDKTANVPFARPSERLYSSGFVRLHTERLLEMAYRTRQEHKGVAGAGVFQRFTSLDRESNRMLLKG
jgi:hypothetical protein